MEKRPYGSIRPSRPVSDRTQVITGMDKRPYVSIRPSRPVSDRTQVIQQKLKEDIKLLRNQYEQTEASLITNLNALNQEMQELKSENTQCKIRCSDLATSHQEFNLERQELCRKISVLSSQLNQRDDENLECQKKVAMLQNELKRMVEENRKYEQLQAQVTTLEKRLKLAEDENSKFVQLNAELAENIRAKDQELLNTTEEHKEEINKLNTAIHIAESEKLDLDRFIKQRDREIQQLKDCVKSLENEVKEASMNAESLQHEKQELVKRLRELLERKKISGDVTIRSEASDDIRPNKLAEEFTALYSNEWKEVFATLRYTGKQNKTNCILELVERADRLCRVSSEMQRTSIKRSFTSVIVSNEPVDQNDNCDTVPGRTSNASASNNIPSDGQGNLRSETVSYRKVSVDFEKLATDQKCAVTAVRAYFADQLAADFEKAAIDVISETLSEELKTQAPVTRFISRCINLCWRMCQHDPPVYLDFQEIADDTAFDTNVYTEYKSSGNRVHFVVWPAVYMHEGGPLLVKGIAEGCQ